MSLSSSVPAFRSLNALSYQVVRRSKKYCPKQHRRREWSWLPVALLVLLAVFAGMASCTTRVYPPMNVADPATVYLLDHGRTPSLVLPTQRGTYVRFAYGDWDYYALRRNDLWHGIAALFWPTQGTLARREVPAEPDDDLEALLGRMNIHPQHVYPLQVERANAIQLHQWLDEVFESNRETMIVNKAYSLEFVHHSRSYTAFYNSNHALADWLRHLGCEVRGPAFTSKWKVVRDEAE